MKIYFFWTDTEKYQSLYISEEMRFVNGRVVFPVSHKFVTHRTLSSAWKPVRATLSGEKRAKVADLCLTIENVPVFSAKAWAALKDLLAKDVEALPLRVPRHSYYAINVLRLLDCLDASKSEIEYARPKQPDGSYVQGINTVKRYVFEPEKLGGVHMFHLLQNYISNVYVSEEFVRVVKKAGLTGGDFHCVWNSEKPLKRAKLVKAVAAPAPEPEEDAREYTGKPNEFGKLTEARLAQFEKKLGAELPADYRQYLLQNNGGLLNDQDARLKGKRQPFALVTMGYGLHQGPEDTRLDHNQKFFRKMLLPEMLPVASEAGGDQVCLAVAGKNRGKVYLWEHEYEEEKPSLKHYRLLAPSVGAFLKMLKPAA